MTRFWCSNNLPIRLNDEILRQSWALPLVPVDRRAEALKIMTEASYFIEEQHPKIAVFLRHAQRMEQFLRQERQIRMVNVTDDLVKQLVSLCCRENPDIWTLLG